MPVMNIGTAKNIYQALKESLHNNGLDFTKAIAFMSDTANVMKGARGQLFVDHWCSLFDSEPKTILKHCPTRWLSLLRCVRRYLEQFEGLLSFFLSCDEQTAKVISITSRLQNPLTKLILHFLAFILPSMNRFSKQFQKSTENTNCELYEEV